MDTSNFVDQLIEQTMSFLFFIFWSEVEQTMLDLIYVYVNCFWSGACPLRDSKIEKCRKLGK